ncbi:hypothetical protein PS1_024703 [Malus domestica]
MIRRVEEEEGTGFGWSTHWRVAVGGGRGLRRLDSKNGKAPPSRNLWLGDLSHRIMGDGLINPFLQFGELESVVFHAGRSYAFINFKREDEAIAAMEFRPFWIGFNPTR